MLKTCTYCGRIHDRKFKCPQSVKPIEERSSECDKFRNTQKWRKKSREIKERDGFMCQVCKRKQHNTIFMYNSDRISTHHILPLKVCWDRRLDNTNLITLCGYHHELAERGVIHKRELMKIAESQEKNNN